MSQQKKMYKKFELELKKSTNTYLEDKIEVLCQFSYCDPSDLIVGHQAGMAHDPENQSDVPSPRYYGIYSVKIDFPLGENPSKEEILAAVNDLPGVVSTY